MNVYAFYQPLASMDTPTELLALWDRSWRDNGKIQRSLISI